MAGAVPAGAGKTAQVVVGFVGTPPQGFQNVLLNVQAVRLNKKGNAAPSNGGWQRIPTPPGIGNKSGTAELQIDLNASQNIPQLFNTADVKKDTYKTAEILLDPNNPGFLVPTCPGAFSRLEGCINYPIALNNSNVILLTDTSNTGLISPGRNNLGVLVLQLTMQINQAPVNPRGAFLVTITASSVPNATVPNSLLATVTGQVTVKQGSGTGTGTTIKIRKLAVSAESIGTNTVIASSRVQTGIVNPNTGNMCPPSPGGCFTLALPAAGGPAPPGFGTLYDLTVTGGTVTFDAERLLPVYPGQTLPTALAFTVTGNQTLGSITGSVKDICTGSPITSATLQLLIPPDSNSSAICATTPEQCVTVASTNTDNVGDFPFPLGTLTVPAQFSNVPVRPKNGPYAMKVTAPGYDDQIVLVKPSPANKKNGGTCMAEGATTFTACNILMKTGFITGSIPITPPNPGQITEVEVFSEDSGTNNLESVLPMAIKVTNANVGTCPMPNQSFSCINFKLNVPTNDTVPALDLFAKTNDPYQGVSEVFGGHNIVVLSGVAAPPPPTAPGMCNTTMGANFSVTDPINCIGHGSITGSVANADLGTSVVLSKLDPVLMQDVLLTNSIVQNQLPNLDSSNNYSFCAPADTYDVQRFQLPTPDPNVTPMAMPTSSPDGNPIPVTIPPAPVINGPTPAPSGSATPTATSTPTLKCPTTCSNPGGGCPGLCNNMTVPIP